MRPRGRDVRGLVLVALLGSLQGSTLVVSRFSLGQFTPLWYTALRFLLAGIVLVPVAITSGQMARRFSWRSLLIGAFVGVVGTALPFGAYVSSLQYQSSGVTALLLTISPMITLILSVLLVPDESLTSRAVLGTIIGLGGAVLLVAFRETGLDIETGDYRGYVLVGAGIVGMAIGSIVIKTCLSKEGVRTVAAVRSVIAAATLIVVASATGELDLDLIETSGWLALLYATGAGTLGTVLLQVKVVGTYGPSKAAESEYVTPLAASILGLVFLGEVITMPMIVGMILIFSGLHILSKSTQKSSFTDEPATESEIKAPEVLADQL